MTPQTITAAAIVAVTVAYHYRHRINWARAGVVLFVVVFWVCVAHIAEAV